MPSSQINSVWKTVETKFLKSNLSRQSLDVSDILDCLNEHFSEREIESVIDGLQNLVDKVYNTIIKQPFQQCCFLYSSSDFQDDIEKFQTKYPQILFINDRLKMVMFILSLVKSKIPGVIERFIKNLFPMYQSFGIMFCQTICNPTIIEKARKILKEDSIADARNSMLIATKELFVEGMKGPPLLNIIHMISSCGKYKTSIINQEMEHEICLDQAPLMEEDGAALSIAVYHCTHLRRLSFFYCILDSKFLQALHFVLLSSKVKIIKLDVSWNEDMDFSVLGKLFKKHKVQKLIMQRCSLNFRKLNAFAKQSGEGKIMKLDVSGNKDMDFSVLGKLFRKHQAQELLMRSCGLNVTKMNDFAGQSGERKIIGLDVSWNADMDFSILGKLFKNYQVEKLIMQCCCLNFEKLNAFTEQSGERKVVEIDVSGNDKMGAEGLSCLTCMMEKHSVERMIMCSCGLSYKNLNGITEGSVLRKMSFFTCN